MGASNSLIVYSENTMSKSSKFITSLFAVMLLTACSSPIKYPEARITDVVDKYHGNEVQDPYRWLEDPDSDETRAWVQAQNKITYPWLESVDARSKVKERIKSLWNFEKFGTPFKRGGRYFFSKNNGLQNQNVIYWTDSLDKEPKILIDPNTFSEDGTVALSIYTVSSDGKWVVYGKSSGGSDWNDWFVRNVDTGDNLNDHLKWIKFARPAWDAGNEGFFYGKYRAPVAGKELQDINYFQKLYYHKLGEDQSEDKIVYERKDHKGWHFSPRVTDDGRYLVISTGQGTERKNLIFYKDLEGGEVKELIKEFKGLFNYVDNNGPKFWFFTDYEAPRGRLVEIDITNPAEKNWRTIIPEADEVLKAVNLMSNRFIGQYLKDAHSQIKTFDITGKFIKEVDLPGLGSVRGFGGRQDESETFYSFSSFNDPGTVYRFDMEAGKSEIYRRPDLAFDPNDYQTRQVFYKSSDNEKIPMFITHKKGLDLDGENPTLLYGYGGFNASMTPSFYVSRVVFMELGGVFALANIRGGGEYGRKWHEAGMKLKKQNSFYDFIAAAQWLIDNDYTRSEKLAIKGGSNGGLLVGACMTKRPDLFGACLPSVGVMDMLRFNKFTIGWAWESDYGSPQNPEEFKVLYSYSPYHNIKDNVSYPATLITTADHDDRVVPAHSYKFAARLQAAQKGEAPVLIRIETKAGHGGGKPTTKRIDEAADIIAFLVRALRIKV